MIVNVRGTNGSGKTTAVRTFMSLCGVTPIQHMNLKGKCEAYELPGVGKRGESVFILGNYTNACGGCDGIQPYDTVLGLIAYYATLGSVLFEGVLISTCKGIVWDLLVNDLSQEHDIYLAYLDTPVELCIERVKGRREVAQNTKPFNEGNLIAKHATIERQYSKASADGCLDAHVFRLCGQMAATQLLYLMTPIGEGGI